MTASPAAASTTTETPAVAMEYEKTRSKKVVKARLPTADRLPSSTLVCTLKRHKCLGSPNHSSTVVLATENPKHGFDLKLCSRGSSRDVPWLPQADSIASYARGEEGGLRKAPPFFRLQFNL